MKIHSFPRDSKNMAENEIILKPKKENPKNKPAEKSVLNSKPENVEDGKSSAEKVESKSNDKVSQKGRLSNTFNQTPIGQLLYAEAPLEFLVIMRTKWGGTMPHPDVIENLSYISENPVFRTERFRRALISYRKGKNGAIKIIKGIEPMDKRKLSDAITQNVFSQLQK